MQQPPEHVAVCVMTCTECARSAGTLKSNILQAVETFVRTSYLVQQMEFTIFPLPILADGLIMKLSDPDVCKEVAGDLFDAAREADLVIYLLLDHPGCRHRAEPNLNVDTMLMVAGLRNARSFVTKWLSGMRGWFEYRPISTVMTGIIVQDRGRPSIMSVTGYESRTVRMIVDHHLGRPRDEN